MKKKNYKDLKKQIFDIDGITVNWIKFTCCATYVILLYSRLRFTNHKANEENNFVKIDVSSWFKLSSIM